MLHESWIPAYAGMTTFYEAVNKDSEYLMRLVDLALAFYLDGVEEGKRATADEL